jgi:DNA end-binding protein Ku
MIMGTPAQSRSLWKGTLTFGLVAMPVKVHAVTGAEDKDSAHQVHDACSTRISMRRWCAECDTEVPFASIVKGFTRGTETVIVTPGDMASLPLATDKTINVEQFTPLTDLDLRTVGKSYYLVPDKGGEKAYRLLRAALESEAVVGIVKVALRQREQVAYVWVQESQIMLTTLVWQDEIRPHLVTDTECANAAEAELAAMLVKAMTLPFNPGEYSDGYAAALAELIDSKATGAALPAAAAVTTPDVGGNLMELVKASIAAKAKAA